MNYSIVNYSNVITHRDFRIDPEHFSPEYLYNIESIRHFKNGYELLGKYIKELTGGATPLGANYPEHGTPFIRVQNIMQNYFDLNDVVYLKKEDDDNLKRSRLKKGDVLLTITGVSYGKSAVVNEKLVDANINQHSVKITLNKDLNPYFLSTFLNCKYGKLQSDQNIVGITRPALDYNSIRNYLIPNFDLNFQEHIKNIISKYNEIDELTVNLYKQAEQILLSDLGLLNWCPKHRLSFVRNFYDTKSADRIDAEYFQPMYEEVEDILSQRNRKSLESICSLINYGTVPTSPYVEKGTPYIKGSNLIDGLIQGDFDSLKNTENLPKNFYTKEHDIIISQMGTVGKAGLVSKDQEDWLFASFTIRIRLKNHDFINPYVLTLYINKVAREWYLMRKIAQASVRQNTDLPTIKGLMVPEIDKKVQQQIREKILNSRKNKLYSKSLLDIAKRGVEMAIEKDEQTAMKWISEQTEKI